MTLSCRFYEVNNVNHFQFSRGIQKGEVKKDNEFSVSLIIDISNISVVAVFVVVDIIDV